MPKYRVLVTRDATESIALEINAPDVHDAEQLAVERAREDDSLVWELDDGNIPHPYIGDPGNSEEIEEDDELDEITSDDHTCYYDNHLCAGLTWECQTCHEHYCQTHWHETSKGSNVECVACERERIETAKEDSTAD